MNSLIIFKNFYLIYKFTENILSIIILEFSKKISAFCELFEYLFCYCSGKELSL